MHLWRHSHKSWGSLHSTNHSLLFQCPSPLNSKNKKKLWRSLVADIRAPQPTALFETTLTTFLFNNFQFALSKTFICFICLTCNNENYIKNMNRYYCFFFFLQDLDKNSWADSSTASTVQPYSFVIFTLSPSPIYTTLSWGNVWEWQHLRHWMTQNACQTGWSQNESLEWNNSQRVKIFNPMSTPLAKESLLLFDPKLFSISLRWRQAGVCKAFGVL